MSGVAMVIVNLPRWENFKLTVGKLLGVGPDESSKFKRVPVGLELPEAVIADLQRMARDLGDEGWTLGRLASYLVVQGTIRVAGQAAQAQSS